MKKIVTLGFLFVVLGSYAQTTTKNYVKETTRRTQSVNAGGGFFFNPENIHITTTTYYDGLGRPIQIVDQNSSPDDNKNIVTHIEYEKNIGQTKEYLPFTSVGYTTTTTGGFFPSTEITYESNFVENGKNLTTSYYDAVYGTTPNPYSENRKEASPRQRVLETGFPSDVWNINQNGGATPEGQRNTIRSSYHLNSASEVKRYMVSTFYSDGIYKNSISENGFYPTNTLTKTIVKNENWKDGDGTNNTVEEFKDPKGNVVLKRTYNNAEAHDTYYVYNDLDLLAFVIPPMANGSVLGDHLDKWCYQYHYDAKKRLVEKKLPQKEWEYIVYDKADRVVMTGPVYNPFGENSKGWLITKYDAFGRSVYTGYYDYTNFSSATRSSLAQNNFAVETKTGANTIDGITVHYSNTSFPTSFKLLSVNYYDDYNYPNAPTSFPVIETQTVNTALKGQLTGSWIRVLTSPTSITGNLSYALYDDKYRPIRSYNQNHLGGYTQMDSKLSFTGMPTKTITYQKQNNNTSVLTITDTFTYDRRDRLMTHTQQIGTGTVETIVANAYNDLGVLINKKVGNTSTTPLQDIGYNYNIRGWLTAVNTLDNNFLAIGDYKFGLFNYAIIYNHTLNGDTSKPQYNGNIASIAWRTQTDNLIRGYGFDYDNLNRLNYASHLKVSGRVFQNYKRDGQYAEDLSYDKNGNIATLKRFGQEDLGQPIEIDDLTYTYNANQLQTVTDATNNAEGFNDANKTGNDFVYDSFGNITQDKNKSITAIKYNHLNLPKEVVFNTGKITYIYDAAGTRLSKKVEPNSGLAVTTDYLSGFQYENGILQFFPHAEGYVKQKGNNQFMYVYQYKDHLGNVRLSYADCDGNGVINPATEILEENNYYPFGLKHKGYNEIVNACRSEAAEKYKFGGKEWNSELGLDLYDFGARNYDPALGRWLNVDPLAENSRRWTPYNYAYNNPIFFIDPDGMQSRPMDSYGRDLLNAGVAFDTMFQSSDFSGGAKADGGRLTTWKVFPDNNKKGSYNAYEQVSTNWDGDPTDVYEVHNNDGSIDIYNSTIELNKAGITNVNRQYKNDKGFFGNLKEVYDGWKNATGRTAAAKETIYAYIGGVGSFLAPAIASEVLIARGGGLLFPLGRGSTGRSAAANITEQFAMKEAMSNPSAGKVIMEGLKDSRWTGWSKMQYVHTGLNGKKTVIHYVAKFEKGVIKYVDDFKFK